MSYILWLKLLHLTSLIVIYESCLLRIMVCRFPGRVPKVLIARTKGGRDGSLGNTNGTFQRVGEGSARTNKNEQRVEVGNEGQK